MNGVGAVRVAAPDAAAEAAAKTALASEEAGEEARMHRQFAEKERLFNLEGENARLQRLADFWREVAEARVRGQRGGIGGAGERTQR